MQSVGKYTYGKTSPGSYKTPPSGIARNSRCGKTRPRSAVGSAASKWFFSGAEGIAVKLCHRGPSSVHRLNYRSADELDVPDRPSAEEARSGSSLDPIPWTAFLPTYRISHNIQRVTRPNRIRLASL